MNSLILTLTLISASIQFPGGEPDGWQMYKQTGGVDILYMYQECHDVKNGIHYGFYILKVVNTTRKAKRILWSQELSYNGVSYQSDKNVFEISVGANETQQGDCDLDNNLRIFVRFLNYKDKPELTGFELKNINIKDL